jgi:preprotein translocase subunit SecD
LKPAERRNSVNLPAKISAKIWRSCLNGEVKSAPTIQGQIFDTGQITGRFTKASAEDLALTLEIRRAARENRVSGRTHGRTEFRRRFDSRRRCGFACRIDFYRRFYAHLLSRFGRQCRYRADSEYAFDAGGFDYVLDSTLTLPGIAGLILGIGMAVDSNVLIFERMREELRAGKSVANPFQSVLTALLSRLLTRTSRRLFRRSFFILYGSGPIRGFAVTLILGLLINLFSAVFVSRTIFMWLLERNPNMKKLSI